MMEGSGFVLLLLFILLPLNSFSLEGIMNKLWDVVHVQLEKAGCQQVVIITERVERAAVAIK
jgi:hypothetical protein